MYRLGSPGQVTVSIRATDEQGLPTGEDLATGAFDGNQLPTFASGERQEVSLDGGVELADETKYVIIAKATSGDKDNYVRWRFQRPSSYPRGAHVFSSDGGSTWEEDTERDMRFEDWGLAPPPPPTLYEYYNTGDDNEWHAYGVIWEAQTFTPVVAHKITSVKLYLLRTGSPGPVTVSIRATDGSGHPTGEDLCSGTTNGDTLPDTENGKWREIALGDGYNLEADTKYAIVIRALEGDSSNRVWWRLDYSDPTYERGCNESSNNSGETWNSFPAYDLMFEEWGQPI
ncbi:hypothetical protein ES708_27425 [subsurface metagenome]